MKSLILGLVAVLSLPALSAEIGQVNVVGTPFENAKITFNENEFGPQLDGLTFAINGREAVGVFFGGRKKRWCAVTKDAKEGTSLDCGFLNKGGEISVWVTGKPELKAKAIHANDRTLQIQFADHSKQIVLKGSIEVEAATRVATAKLEVHVVEAEKVLTTASHTVGGVYLSASAQIKRQVGNHEAVRNPAKSN